jgi:hypothetical protein
VAAAKRALDQIIEQRARDRFLVELHEARRGQDLERLIREHHEVGMRLGHLAAQRALHDHHVRVDLRRQIDASEHVHDLAADLQHVAGHVAA